MPKKRALQSSPGGSSECRKVEHAWERQRLYQVPHGGNGKAPGASSLALQSALCGRGGLDVCLCHCFHLGRKKKKRKPKESILLPVPG